MDRRAHKHKVGKYESVTHNEYYVNFLKFITN